MLFTDAARLISRCMPVPQAGYFIGGLTDVASILVLHSLRFLRTLIDDTTPVSYTHLDVYKRQTLLYSLSWTKCLCITR